MSNQLNQELRFWKVVEDNLRCISVHHKSSTLSKEDCAMFRDAVFLQGVVMSDILACRTPDRRSRLPRWCYTIVGIELSDLFTSMKDLLSFFRNYSENSTMSYKAFKQLWSEYSFIGDLLSPIKEEVVAFLEQPGPITFSIINQHLSFLSRLTFKSVDFSRECLRDYCETEKRLADLELDSDLVLSLNRIIRNWFTDFRIEDFCPQHGPGGVSVLGRCPLIEKYLNLSTDVSLRMFLNRVDYKPDLWGSPTPLDRACEIVFVPKSSTSYRTISMEPATLQYYQQGIWKSLDEFMMKHDDLRLRVHLHDSEWNKNAARIGSVKPRRLATIDLSAASDSVSWELVKNVFKGTPLLMACYSTRSREAILPDGSRLALKKFAPMGSALCFPVECIIFAAICEHVVRQSRTRTSSNYLVYGDDIVIEERHVAKLYDVLQSLGFVVNKSKSFHRVDLPFRESCGGEFYDGLDVTPLRLSRKFSSESPSVATPTVFSALVDLCNSLGRYNCRTARRIVIGRLLSLPEKLRPLFSESDSHLSSPCPTNYHLKRKFYRNWGAEYYLHGTLVNKQVDHELDSHPLVEDIRLFEWLRTAHGRTRPCYSVEDVVCGTVGKTSVKLTTGKTPV